MEDLQRILDVSRKDNVSADITGLLCYDPSYFLQCLEGPKAAVENLYATILADKRHTDVVLLDARAIDGRIFGDWRMAFLKAVDLDPKILARFTSGAKFDPYALSPEQSWGLFSELARCVGK